MSRNTFSETIRPFSRGRGLTVATAIKSLAVLIATVSTPVSLRAQSCNATLTNLQTWITTAPAGTQRWLGFTLASNRSDDTSATYSDGGSGALATLTYSPVYWVNPYEPLLFPNLQGNATQYFSNNQYSTSGDPSFLGGAPFNPLASWFGTGFQNSPATQTLHVMINLPPFPYGPLGLVTLTSGSEPSVSFTPSCQDGILYGFVTDSKGTTIYAMNLIERETGPTQ
jgi:hypothetical protein